MSLAVGLYLQSTAFCEMFERCGDCGHHQSHCSSGAIRNCPKCQAAARAEWLAARETELPPTSSFHVVFTPPRPDLPTLGFPTHSLRHVSFSALSKFEALDKFVIDARRHLNYITSEFQVHYNRERPHEARGNLPAFDGDCTATSISNRPIPSSQLGGVAYRQRTV